MTFKIHILLHAADCVGKWGLLWDYSAYGFEDSNGRFLNMFNRTQYVALQILKRFTKFQTLKAENTRIKDFYSGHVNETFLELTDKFLGKIPLIKKHVNVYDIHFLGCGKEKVLSCQEIQLIAETLTRYPYWLTWWKVLKSRNKCSIDPC